MHQQYPKTIEQAYKKTMQKELAGANFDNHDGAKNKNWQPKINSNFCDIKDMVPKAIISPNSDNCTMSFQFIIRDLVYIKLQNKFYINK